MTRMALLTSKRMQLEVQVEEMFTVEVAGSLRGNSIQDVQVDLLLWNPAGIKKRIDITEYIDRAMESRLIDDLLNAAQEADPADKLYDENKVIDHE